MKKFAISGFLLFFFFTAFGQEVGKVKIETQLRTLRNDLSDFIPEDADIGGQLILCKQYINEAIINIDSRDVSYTGLYSETLDGLIRLALGLPKDELQVQRMAVHIIYRDLQLKFINSKHGLFNLRYVQQVLVTVVTRGTAGLRVNYTPAGNTIDYQHPDHQFKHLTTPASEEMAPGIYELWLTRDNSTSVIKHLEVEVNPGNQDNTVEF